MAEILVIGCASHDVLHIAGQTYNTIGGAGLYTALAAARGRRYDTACPIS